jgi:hypothetical protein
VKGLPYEQHLRSEEQHKLIKVELNNKLIYYTHLRYALAKIPNRELQHPFHKQNSSQFHLIAKLSRLPDHPPISPPSLLHVYFFPPWLPLPPLLPPPEVELPLPEPLDELLEFPELELEDLSPVD